MKFKIYDNETLTNARVTLKIDGVQCRLVDGRILSRKDKPLYGIDPKWLSPGRIYEVYCDGFKNTIQIVRAQKGVMVKKQHLYCLNPIDPRLELCEYRTLTPDNVKELLEKVLSYKYEGLIIYATQGEFKVKEIQTHDVVVLDLLPGKGKYINKLGAFITPMGNVGTGLTDAQRAEFNHRDMVGEIIEVECMELTPYGKFRHPRFLRHRFDK